MQQRSPSLRIRIVTRAVMIAGSLLLVQPRAAHAQQVAALPEYRPEQQVSGVIRSWGSRQMEPLLKAWEAGFRKYQPSICFADSLKGTATAQFGLHEWVADLAISSRKIYPYEYYGVYRRSLMYPVEIAVATGSFDVPGKSAALAVFVNRKNPLSEMTMQQLDGVFGAHRTGGWQELSWIRTIARGPEQDIRTWGQLGLTGRWANAPIHVYGPPGIYPGGVSFFQTRVMGGADSWNEDLREYADASKMMKAVNADPYAIAYTSLSYATKQVKPLAHAEHPGGPYVPLTPASVQNRTYPLSRLAYIYFAPDQPNGDPAVPPVAPKIREFLLYILSRQGQADVRRVGSYLPLTPQLVLAQRHKLADMGRGVRAK